jgi:hypothetical protein
MRQYVQTDLEADRQVANTLAALIIGRSVASVRVPDEVDDQDWDGQEQDQTDDTDENEPDNRGGDAAA